MYQYLNLSVYLGLSFTSPHMKRTGVPASVIGMIERRTQSILIKDLISRQATVEATLKANNKVLHEKLDKVLHEKLDKLPEKLYGMFQNKVQQPNDVLQLSVNSIHLQVKDMRDQLADQIKGVVTELQNLKSNQNNKKRKCLLQQELVDLSSSASQRMPRKKKRAKISTFRHTLNCADAWEMWWNPDSECNYYVTSKKFRDHPKSARVYSQWEVVFKTFVVHLTDGNAEMKALSESYGINLPNNLDDLFDNSEKYLQMLGKWFDESTGVPVTLELLMARAPQTIYNCIKMSLKTNTNNYTFPNTIQRNEAMKSLEIAQSIIMRNQQLSESESCE